MKVACVDNMNHIMFSLARFLRDGGIEADLLLVPGGAAHFHPSADAFDDDYRGYTRDLTWGTAASFFKVTGRQVRRDLARYDAVIGCGFVPAFMEKAGRPLDIFVPRGDDLVKFPFGVGRRHWLRRLPGAYLSRAQRRGIQHARRIFCPDFYGPYRSALARLGVAYDRVPGTPVYYPQYDRLADASIQRRLAHRDAFDRLRDRWAFLLFSHARHYWRTSERIGYRTGKGNNLLIEGFAGFLRESGRPDAAMVLLEYGDDVAASKALCARLGIADRICWFPALPRRELMYGARTADVGADQFPTEDRDGAYGGCAVELMSLGKPVLGRLFYTAAEFRERVGFPMPPIVNTRSVEDITANIGALAAQPCEVSARGQAGRAWVRDHYGEGIVSKYLEAIGAA